jgi:hypothetical protein
MYHISITQVSYRYQSNSAVEVSRPWCGAEAEAWNPKQRSILCICRMGRTAGHALCKESAFRVRVVPPSLCAAPASLPRLVCSRCSGACLWSFRREQTIIGALSLLVFVREGEFSSWCSRYGCPSGLVDGFLCLFRFWTASVEGGS